MTAPVKRENARARVNEQITVVDVRLIDAEGNQMGIVPTKEALRLAVEQELDLVEISPTAQPPVCRIMNYGKFLFELNKKQNVAKKKQKQNQVKELKFRPATEEGDYQVKLRNLIRFLQHGDKVKITIRFRGREVAHQDLGMRVIERLQTDIVEHGVVEQHAKKEGRQIVMVLAPKKK